jgi:hypothetical protein
VQMQTTTNFITVNTNAPDSVNQDFQRLVSANHLNEPTGSLM